MLNIVICTALLTIIIAGLFAALMFVIDKNLIKKDYKKLGFVCKYGAFAILLIIFMTDSVMISSSAFVDGTSMNPTLEDGEMLNMTASVTAFGHVLLREQDTFEKDDIIVFETNGFMGYDSLDAIDDIEQDGSDINNQIIKGQDLSNQQGTNTTYIKRVQYIEDVNGDGVDDYYVRGDNRENALSSVDSKNFGFVDGRSVLGVVQDDINYLFFVLFFEIILFAFVFDGVVTKYLNKKF